MKTHLAAATAVYRQFLEKVVQDHVFSDRSGVVSEKAEQRIFLKKTHVDHRPVRLMTISGKGGWSPQPELAEKYRQSRNVTLLDHLLSVVRGAILLRCMDASADIEPETLERQLAAAAAIAFMHDIDKDLGLARNASIEIDQVEERMQRYGLPAFLAQYQMELAPDQLLSLIELVEDTQARRTFATTPPPRSFERMTRYVKLADKLDGAWLSHGLEGVRERLVKDRTMGHQAWKEVTIHDPHHPFILDELQGCLSKACVRQAHILPLIETHLDGVLYMLLPAAEYDRIVERGLQALKNRLPFKLELNISKPGVPELQNDRPDFVALTDFIHNLDERSTLGRLFLIKTGLATELSDQLDDLLTPLGLAPRWPKATSNKLQSPFSTLENISARAKQNLHKAALLSMLMGLKLPTGKKYTFPNYTEREQQLLQACNQEPPSWLSVIGDDKSRRNITALWAVALAEEDPEAEQAIWGGDSLLVAWWQGSEKITGFRQVISTEGARINLAVLQRYQQMLNHKLVIGAEATGSKQPGHCIFTNEPVSWPQTICAADNLYQVKISAFSGRDNRPESLAAAAKGITHVSPVSIAEYRLRHTIHQQAGGKPAGVPSLISSPTTSSLFGGLAMKSEDLVTLSVYDANRLEIKKGRVLRHELLFSSRQRIARFERWPERVQEQIQLLDLLLRTCRRTGRPIHLFRGLPTPQKSFFYCDALPPILTKLLGGNELRLEQLDSALRQLETAATIIEENSLGHVLLKLYADSVTRLGAICQCWCHFHTSSAGTASSKNKNLAATAQRLQQEYNHLKEEPMSQNDAPLVTLGEYAAGIQKTPNRNASTNEEMLCFKLAMDTLRDLVAQEQTDARSLTYGIGGELEHNLERKGKTFLSQASTRQERCLDFADFFVKEIWQQVLKERLPSQRRLRALGSIYRMSFLTAARRKYDDSASTDATGPTGTNGKVTAG